MSHLYFKNHKSFYNYLIEQGVDLDINKTCLSSRFTFYTNDGKCHFHSKLSSMLDALNESVKGDKFDTKRSIIKGQLNYLIYLREDSQEVVFEKTEKEPELEVFDIEHATSLQEGVSKKEAKELLVSYAAKFDIAVEARGKFEDILASIQEKL